jgi:acetoin utilization protein AcuB
MLVRNWMTSSPTTVSPGTSVALARELVVTKRIRHLPVCEGEQLVGIVTDRDIRTALPSPSAIISVWEARHTLDQLSVGDVMTRSVITITEYAPIGEAVRLMVAHRIGALPVTRDERLVGILSETDLLGAFAAVLGQPVTLTTRAAVGGRAYFEVA